MSVAARLNSRITQLAVGRHLPHRTVRVRLTLLYGALFVLSGAALMAITYVLLVNAGFVFTIQNGPASNSSVVRMRLSEPPQGELVSAGPSPAHAPQAPAVPAPGSTTDPSTQTMAQWRGVAECMRQHGISAFPNPTNTMPADLTGVRELADRDGALLAIPATIDTGSPAFTDAATACGFAPDRELTSAAVQRRTQVRQQLLIQSGIALAGMSLLSLGLGWLVAGRVLQPLQDSYEAQRQFVANASHELRAPLTRQRAVIEVSLANPDADVASLRTAHERVLASEQHLERIIDGLLALTRGQAGLESREPVDLASLTSQAMLAHESQIAGLGLDVRRTLDPAPTVGDPRLLERLVGNLIDNAIRHNTPGGHVEITTGTRHQHAFLTVTNSGPKIPPEEVSRLLQPFQRLGAARTRHNSGHGLGLSIVQAIANAHRAELSARTRPEGGLTVAISFPPATAAGPRVASATGWSKRVSPRTSLRD